MSHSASSPSASTSDALRVRFEKLLEDPSRTAIERLKELVYCADIPEDENERDEESTDCATLRGRVWVRLLGVTVSAEEYLATMRDVVVILEDDAHPKHKALSSFYTGVVKDANRARGAWRKGADGKTESRLNRIKRRCTTEKISRIVMALALQASDLKPPPVFVQGMCNIAAVLLYVMPELDAFYCFKKLYCSEFRLLGVEEFQGKGIALKMLKIALRRCDAGLLEKLDDQWFSLLIFLSNYFHAGSGPLEHLLRLWDVFVGWGFHLSIIVGVARLVNARNQIMNERDLARILAANTFPPIDHPDILIDLLVPMLKDLAIGANGEVLDMLWYFLRAPQFIEDVELADREIEDNRPIPFDL